jgi:chaperonin cofactor prefoldin
MFILESKHGGMIFFILPLILLVSLLTFAGCSTQSAKEQFAVSKQATATHVASIDASATTIRDNATTLTEEPAKTAILNESGAILKVTPKLTKEAETQKAAFDTLQKENNKLKAEIKELNESISSKVRFWVTFLLYFVGIASGVWAAIRVYSFVSSFGASALASGGLASLLKSNLALIVVAAASFTIANFIGSTWFWYACYGVTGVSVVSAIGYVVLDNRKKDAAVLDGNQSWQLIRKFVKLFDISDGNTTVDTLYAKMSTIFTPEERSLINSAKADNSLSPVDPQDIKQPLTTL